MRRLLAAVVGLGVVGILIVPGAVAQVPTQDSVVGSLVVPPVRPGFAVTINAFSGPSGESPTGTIEAVTRDGGPFTFPVTCLHVTGNRGVIGSRQVLGSDVLQVYLLVVDEPGDTPDRAQLRFFLNEPLAPATCAEYAAVTAGISPDSGAGSVVVTDAQPLPISKDQCKNGGWHNFTGFRNQGDCVSFVATHGENPPGT
jgi:hypothetical protein